MIVRYFFEDHEDSLLPSFFLGAYNDVCRFTFSKGKDNLVPLVEAYLESTEQETALVYLDTVVDNPYTVQNYADLRALSIQHDYRCIVLPIVCAEFYYLQSLKDSGLVKDADIYNVCLEKRYYRTHPYLQSHSKGSYSTFERLCKFLCDQNLYKCASVARDGKTKCPPHRYTKEDCHCSGAYPQCREIDLQDKRRNFLRAYHYIPRGAGYKDLRVGSADDAWAAHRELVQQYNTWVEFYRKADPNTTYTTIRYIR